MEISSTSLSEGQPIALTHAEPGAGGHNTTPQLSWSGAPEGTRSFAITCYDPDAPTGSGFWHWVAYDIPAEVTSLDEDANLPDGSHECEIDYGYAGYGGPCPPPGPAHRYEFTVHALPVEKLEVPAGATHVQARFAIHTQRLDHATLTGTFALPEDAA